MIEYTDEPVSYFIHLHNNYNKVTCGKIEIDNHKNEIIAYNKQNNCKIQLEQIKSEINIFSPEHIKNIYNIGNCSAYSCLSKYDEIPIRIKQILIKIKINEILIEEFNVQIKEHNEQLKECLEYYGINKEMIHYFKTNGYNIFDTDFLEYIKTVFNNKVESKIEKSRRLIYGDKILNDTTRNILCKHNGKEIKHNVKQNIHDMYIFKNFESCYDKQNEILKLGMYPLLFENEKEVIVTINYYYYQQNKINIQLLKFSEDIYVEIFKNFIKPKQVSIMSLVCKMFNKNSNTKVIKLTKAQQCPICCMPLYERTLSIQCNTCNQLEHIKCFNIMFKSINIIHDCIPLILQYFKSKDFVKLSFICKDIYNIVKKFIIPISPIKLVCKNNEICNNSVCVIGKSLKSEILCGNCLNFKVFFSHFIPNKSWNMCYKCGCHYLVGQFGEGIKSKCQICR